MDERLKINCRRQVKLKNPVLVAAWPGMGHVALKAVRHLQQILAAEPLGELIAADFFPVSQVVVRGGIIEPAAPPQGWFFYWQRQRGSGGDILLHLGEQQPVAGKEYALCAALLDFAARLGVRRVYAAAAMPSAINHYQASRVWVAATEPRLVEEVRPFCDRVLDEGQISGMNGVILGVAKARGMEGCCLLGEIPFYTTQIENPKAAAAVLEVLGLCLNLDLDLDDLHQETEMTTKEIDRYLLELQQQEAEEEPQDKEGPVTVH